MSIDGSSSSDGGKKDLKEDVQGRVSYDESLQLKKKEIPKEKPIEVLSRRWSYDEALSRQTQGESTSGLKDTDTLRGSIESRSSFDSTLKPAESSKLKQPEVKVVPDISKAIPKIEVTPDKPKVIPKKQVIPEIKVLPQTKVLGGSAVPEKKDPKPPQQAQKPPSPGVTKKPQLPKDLGTPFFPEPPKPISSLSPGTLPKLKEKTQTPPSAKLPPKEKVASDLKTKLKSFLDNLKRQAKDVLDSQKKSQTKKASPTDLPKERSQEPYPSLIIMADQKGGGASSMGRVMKFPYTFSAQVAQFPLKFYMNNNWMWKYYAIALGVCIPIFYKIGKASNTPENKRVWDENRRKAFTPGAHH